MAQERLLERITRLESKSKDLTQTDAEREITSIILHLQRMLNSRQGSVLIALDYGIPDFTNFPGETLLATGEKMERVMRETILKFEPRLKNVNISFDNLQDDVLALRFKLDAFLCSDDSIPVVFETVLTSSGKCNIVK